MADESPAATPAEPTEKPAETVDDGKPHMAVKVYAPFKVYFEGDAKSITAENATGLFDILPHHHNFLCMLVPCDLIVQTPDGEKQTITIHRAVMHVKADRVSVFVDV